MSHTAVSIDDMRGQLISLDTARERLAQTEPLTGITFACGSGAKIRLGTGWHDGELTNPADAWLRVSENGEEYQLTRQAVMQLGSEAHYPRKGQEWLSAALLEDIINYGLSAGWGNKEYKLLVQESTALAFTRHTITPFSNLALLDSITTAIRKSYGNDAELLVDYKFHHDLETTALRVIVPGHDRIITNDRVPDDTWSTGIQLDNSLIGLRQTKLGGYLFRHWCTNGMYDVKNASGGFSRRGDHTPEEAYAWAEQQVEDILGGLEHTLDNVQTLTSIPVEGEVVPVLRDLFEQHSIPKAERERVIDTMADLGGELTLYDVQSAITQAANLDGLHPRSVNYLLTAGGHLAHASSDRCNEDHPCRRLMPAGWEPPAEAAESGEQE